MPQLAPAVASKLRASDSRIVVTGASGWIGKVTLELLYEALSAEAFRARVVAFGSTSRTIDFGAGSIAQRPLSALLSLPPAPSLVLHLAFLTKDKCTEMDETKYRRLNQALSRTVLESLDMIEATAVFVASSGAARFAHDPAAAPALRLYGSAKEADEIAFAAWARSRDRRAVIARIFALSGPHMNKPEAYALASFIRDALAGGPITVKADRPVFRSYVAIRELMSLVFAALLDDEVSVLRFSTGGERLEMQQIAEAVSENFGDVQIKRPALSGDSVDEYTGDHDQYSRVLATYGLEHIALAQQVAESAGSFASDPSSERRTVRA